MLLYSLHEPRGNHQERFLHMKVPSKIMRVTSYGFQITLSLHVSATHSLQAIRANILWENHEYLKNVTSRVVYGSLHMKVIMSILAHGKKLNLMFAFFKKKNQNSFSVWHCWGPGKLSLPKVTDITFYQRCDDVWLPLRYRYCYNSKRISTLLFKLVIKCGMKTILNQQMQKCIVQNTCGKKTTAFHKCNNAYGNSCHTLLKCLCGNLCASLYVVWPKCTACLL